MPNRLPWRPRLLITQLLNTLPPPPTARKLLQLLSPRTLFGPGSAGTGSVTPRAGGETDPGLPLGGTTAPSNVPGPASGPLATNGNGIPCPDQTTVLDLHNSARAARGASPLQYSDQLAQDAATWSGQCKKDGAGYAHADDYSTGGFGESLGGCWQLAGACCLALSKHADRSNLLPNASSSAWRPSVDSSVTSLAPRMQAGFRAW